MIGMCIFYLMGNDVNRDFLSPSASSKQSYVDISIAYDSYVNEERTNR